MTAGASGGDAIIGRMERLPFTRLHRRVMAIFGLATLFDAFDLLALGSQGAIGSATQRRVITIRKRSGQASTARLESRSGQARLARSDLNWPEASGAEP